MCRDDHGAQSWWILPLWLSKAAARFTSRPFGCCHTGGCNDSALLSGWRRDKMTAESEVCHQLGTMQPPVECCQRVGARRCFLVSSQRPPRGAPAPHRRAAATRVGCFCDLVISFQPILGCAVVSPFLLKPGSLPRALICPSTLPSHIIVDLGTHQEYLFVTYTRIEAPPTRCKPPRAPPTCK